MVNIRQMLVSKDKYSVKCPYNMNPIGITVHNTANDSSANNEVSYMISNSNEVSFHFAVDDIEIVQGIPEDRNAWHAGDGGSGQGNRGYLSIEICYSKSGGDKFSKSEENAADLIVYLLKKYGWSIDRVKKHQDFSGKYCPHRTLDMGWQRFLDKVQARLSGSQTIQTNQSTQTAQTTQASSTESRYAEQGTFYFNQAVTVRTAPEENAKTDVVYSAGESVIYHHVILNKNGFNWIEYARNNGTTGYLKVKDLSNGESYGYAK